MEGKHQKGGAEKETIREKEKHRYWSISNRHGSDSTVLHNYIIAVKEKMKRRRV